MSIQVKLKIDNYYDGDKVRTVVETTIEDPPFALGVPSMATDEAMDRLSDWEQEEIFPHTGTGQETGDSAYFVTVDESSHPDLLPVGKTFEFGT